MFHIRVNVLGQTVAYPLGRGRPRVRPNPDGRGRLPGATAIEGCWLDDKPGVMSVWVRYTDRTLGRLQRDVEAVAPAAHRFHPEVIDDGVADLVFDVGSEGEGVELVSGLDVRLRDQDGLEIVSATFFPKRAVS